MSKQQAEIPYDDYINWRTDLNDAIAALDTATSALTETPTERDRIDQYRRTRRALLDRVITDPFARRLPKH